MPRKGDQMTYAERRISEVMATTGDKKFAAHAAGVSPTSGAVEKAIARPAVQAEIAKIQIERLFGEALPAAVQCLISIATDSKAAAGARVQASKVILDRTLGRDDATGGKEPHEMTADELAKAIEALERVAAERARPISATIVEPADEGILG